MPSLWDDLTYIQSIEVDRFDSVPPPQASSSYCNIALLNQRRLIGIRSTISECESLTEHTFARHVYSRYQGYTRAPLSGDPRPHPLSGLRAPLSGCAGDTKFAAEGRRNTEGVHYLAHVLYHAQTRLSCAMHTVHTVPHQTLAGYGHEAPDISEAPTAAYR